MLGVSAYPTPAGHFSKLSNQFGSAKLPSLMDLPNILNNRGPAAAAAAAAAAADSSLPHYDVSGRSLSDTGSERGMSPHMSDNASRFPSRSGSQYPSMNMTSAPHLQQAFPMVQNPYPTPTESIDSGFAHAQNEDHPVQNPPTSNPTESSAQSKAFACSTCGKGFARRSDLARHGTNAPLLIALRTSVDNPLERIHSGIRPHVCEFPGCGKQFIQRSALTVHSRVHTGEKPHMCEHCTKVCTCGLPVDSTVC